VLFKKCRNQVHRHALREKKFVQTRPFVVLKGGVKNMKAFSFCSALFLQHHGTISANIDLFQKLGQLCSVVLISW